MNIRSRHPTSKGRSRTPTCRYTARQWASKAPRQRPKSKLFPGSAKLLLSKILLFSKKLLSAKLLFSKLLLKLKLFSGSAGSSGSGGSGGEPVVASGGIVLGGIVRSSRPPPGPSKGGLLSFAKLLFAKLSFSKLLLKLLFSKLLLTSSGLPVVPIGGPPVLPIPGLPVLVMSSKSGLIVLVKSSRDGVVTTSSGLPVVPIGGPPVLPIPTGGPPVLPIGGPPGAIVVSSRGFPVVAIGGPPGIVVPPGGRVTGCTLVPIGESVGTTSSWSRPSSPCGMPVVVLPHGGSPGPSGLIVLVKSSRDGVGTTSSGLPVVPIGGPPVLPIPTGG